MEFSEYKSDMFSTSRLSPSLVSRTFAIVKTPTGDDSEETYDPSHSLKLALIVLASDNVVPGRDVEFEGFECAFASFLSSVGSLGVYLEVYTSRLVGCLLGELDNQLHRL